MNMKEKLLKIKEKLLYKKSIENFETDDMKNYSKTKQMDNQDNLDQNIHSFLNWYRQFLLDNDIFLSDLDDTIKNMENLIDKMAIWYELRYPDYEIGKLLPTETSLSITNSMSATSKLNALIIEVSAACASPASMLPTF